jgi:hypothetical protein
MVIRSNRKSCCRTITSKGINMKNAILRVTKGVSITTLQHTPVELKHITADATEPTSASNGDCRFLVHCCNDVGAWGSGFVMALSERWPEPEAAYRAWYDGYDTVHRTTGPLQMGEVQFVHIDQSLVVCNLIGQHATGRQSDGVPPVRYEAIELGLAKIRLAMEGMLSMGYESVTFHSPKFGADRAGGDWDRIEQSIKTMMTATSVPSTVYTWPPVKVSVPPD